jgi:5'-nucleotidase
MKRTLLVAALSASALALSAQASFADYELNILHMNDWHSRIESNNAFESTCSAEDEAKDKCIGGAARLVTAVRQEREKLKDQNVIFLNAGDNFQGSLFFTTYHGAAEGEFLNIVKPDAMTIGNHEFDEGEDSLKAFFDMAQFPIISANVRPDMQSKLADKVKPSIILEVGGEKIGIVGAVANDTDELSSPGKHIEITNDVEAITAAVKDLARQGVSKIIALTHVGYPRDMEAIAKIPGVDVVVGGHSHTLLSNTDPKAAGPYPTWVDNPLGYKVPIVQAASYSKYLGEVKVTFSDLGIVKDAKGDPIPLDASVKPDEAVLARVKELKAPIEEAMGKVVGATTAPVNGSRDTCRAKECEMGDLVTDAMLDRVKDQGVTIVITNGGGLRASIDQGEVTMGEVVAVLPFQNTLATFELKGSDVVAALENGVSQIEDGAGRFAQVAGLRYTFDRSGEPNKSRIQSVEVKDGDGWSAIEPDKTYKVASNNFMRAGGDGYSVFAEKGMNAYDYGPGLETVVADYIAAHNPYEPKTEGRITEAAAAAAPAAEKPAAEEAAKPADAAAGTPNLPAGATDIATTPPTVAVEPAKPAETAAAEPAKADAAAAKSYTVAAGDNLWNIAKNVLGDASKWPAIAQANGLKKPFLLHVGQELKLP